GSRAEIHWWSRVHYPNQLLVYERSIQGPGCLGNLTDYVSFVWRLRTNLPRLFPKRGSFAIARAVSQTKVPRMSRPLEKSASSSSSISRREMLQRTLGLGAAVALSGCAANRNAASRNVVHEENM